MSLAPVNIVHGPAEHSIAATVYNYHLVQLTDSFSHIPSVCSFVSYFVRAEGTVHKDEFRRQKDVGLDKELQAALWHETKGQILDYRGSLFGIGSTNLHPQLESLRYRTRALWEKGIRQIAQHFSSITSKPLLPRYNSKKNVSYETCEDYYSYLGYSREEAINLPMSVTSLDLLKLYYRTGHQTQGGLEMRLAWFFNDLKPRIYYCLGGTDFWHGIYIQQIANLFCEILPSTNPFSRFTVSRVGDLDFEDLLITYDYSSFTTSLSELKYFMFWLAEACRGISVSFLDVVKGVVSHDLGDVLHNYNTAVNQYQAFSIERFQQLEERYPLHQGRSGSLGVKGNIVFSTTLHGLSLSEITGTPDNDCCVGDDALARVRSWFLVIFIACVNNLGDINPDKFTSMLRPKEDESESQTSYKFLKRPLWVGHDGVVNLGYLDFFPSMSDVLFPDGDGVHTATPGYSQYGAARTFAMQWGRYLTIQTMHGTGISISRDEDLEFILSGIRLCYKRLGLPLEGGIPGDDIRLDDRTVRQMKFFCPPADTTQLFYEHWMEILLFRYHGRYTSLPLTSGGTIPPPLYAVEGETFTATSDVECLGLLVDLGVIESEVLVKDLIFDEAVMREVLSRLEFGPEVDEPLMCRYTILEPLPSWYFDVVSFEYPLNLVEDPDEAMERVTSVLSGSVV